MRLTSSIGTILLAVYLILVGLTYCGLAIPGIILGIFAIIAAVFLLIGR